MYEGNFSLTGYMVRVHNSGYILEREDFFNEQFKAIPVLMKLIELCVDLGILFSGVG